MRGRGGRVRGDGGELQVATEALQELVIAFLVVESRRDRGRPPEAAFLTAEGHEVVATWLSSPRSRRATRSGQHA